jgi:D-sedoheptulose 7-phosphate isomerase
LRLLTTNGLVQPHNRTLPTDGVPSAALPLLLERQQAFGRALDRLSSQAPVVDRAARTMISCLKAGGKILIAGNGGSAAEAQHFATELVGRFLRERAPYPVLSLTADTAVITALANDYGYDSVFARQVCAFGKPGDVFVAFSTSGKSRNLINAAEMACDHQVKVLAVTGGTSNRLAEMADVAICVPAVRTPIIQELHTIVLHVLCDLIETELASAEPLERGQ